MAWARTFIQREIVRERTLPRVGTREIYNFLAMAGLYVVNFLVVMMTVLTSVDTLAGEIASGTMQAVATKPLRRFEIVLGKWLGFGGDAGVVRGADGRRRGRASCTRSPATPCRGCCAGWG